LQPWIEVQPPWITTPLQTQCVPESLRPYPHLIQVPLTDKIHPVVGGVIS